MTVVLIRRDAVTSCLQLALSLLVGSCDELLELSALDAPLTAPAELDRHEVTTLHQGTDLRLAGGKLLGHLRDGQEPAGVGVGDGMPERVLGQCLSEL